MKISKVATILAITCLISFGLCAAGASINDKHGIAVAAAAVFGWISGLSFLLLVLTGLAAVVMAIANTFRSKGGE